MATLGELLFYIATTQQDVPGGGTVQEAADLWGLNTGTITSVVRSERLVRQPKMSDCSSGGLLLTSIVHPSACSGS